MKKTFKFAVLFIIVMPVMVFIYFWFTRFNQIVDIPEQAMVQPDQMIDSSQLQAKELLSLMSLEDKVGQMFMVGFWGTEPDMYIVQAINEMHVGGVILLKYNIESQEQVQTLISDLQTASLIPLFIGVDQEGGEVTRVQLPEVKETTSQPQIISADQAYQVASERAKEIKQLGFNLNFSPVLDNISNENSFLYNRVFRGSVADLAAYGTAMVNGYQDNGIISVIKHFPGHGNDSVDSHEDLPVRDLSWPELVKDSEQFGQVIGSSSPGMTMVGHIAYPQIDDKYPSSLSDELVNATLREEFGYWGVVITDDMEMKALQNNFTTEQAAVRAVIAGNDILLYSSTPENYQVAYQAILEAVNNNQISEEQIDQSVTRILLLKEKYLAN